MAENWWDELRGNERRLYLKFRQEMIKKEGLRFPEKCSPSEWERLFEEWKKAHPR